MITIKITEGRAGVAHYINREVEVAEILEFAGQRTFLLKDGNRLRESVELVDARFEIRTRLNPQDEDITLEQYQVIADMAFRLNQLAEYKCSALGEWTPAFGESSIYSPDTQESFNLNLEENKRDAVSFMQSLIHLTKKKYQNEKHRTKLSDNLFGAIINFPA